MHILFKELRKTRTLVILLVVAIPLTLLSKWSVAHWGLQLLDGVSDPDVARYLIAHMTTAQRSGHIWFTTTLDVIYPIAAASLFASVALKSFGKYGPILAIAPLVALPLDLAEGVIQVLALTDTADLLPAKAYTTPIKSLCYGIGLLLSLIGLARWVCLAIGARVASSA